MIFLIEDFISSEQCSDLIQAFRRASSNGDIPAGHLRLSPERTELTAKALYKVSPLPVRQFLDEFHARLVNTVNSALGGEAEYFIEFSVITEMRKGDRHVAHADNERLNPSGIWEPNHTPFRDYTTMLYLNSTGADYSGGTLRFVALGQQIEPKAGLLVGFRCDHVHMHEALPIEVGTRYAVSIWYTKDREREQSLSGLI